MLKSQFLNIAYQIISLEKRPMKPSEIVDEALRRGLFPDNLSGKTPHQTMKSKLSVHVKLIGERSIFVRVKPGYFYLRELLDDNDVIFNSKPIIKPKSKELVLTISDEWFARNSRFQGINSNWRSYLNKMLTSPYITYKERYAAESDNKYKQFLTYVIVARGHNILCYKRGNYNRVEDFLRGSLCIGFGGHVIQQDRDLFSETDLGIQSCVLRELSEELVLPSIDMKRLTTGEGLQILGLLNDDSSTVGERHFAVVFKYEVSSDASWDHPARGEKSITQLTWLSPGSNIAPIWNFEYWSQLCLRQFAPKLVLQAAAYRLRRKKPFLGPHILCVLGEVSSGKSLATKLLCLEYGYHEINSGKVLARLLKLPPVPETPREQLQKAAWEFINKSNGPEILANAIVLEASKIAHSKILIDGIRQKSTLEALQRIVGTKKIAVIFVHTTPDLAFNFFKKREQRPTADVFDFLNIRNAAVEKEVRSMISFGDIVVYNWAGEALFRTLIRQAISETGGVK